MTSLYLHFYHQINFPYFVDCISKLPFYVCYFHLFRIHIGWTKAWMKCMHAQLVVDHCLLLLLGTPIMCGQQSSWMMSKLLDSYQCWKIPIVQSVSLLLKLMSGGSVSICNFWNWAVEMGVFFHHALRMVAFIYFFSFFSQRTRTWSKLGAIVTKFWTWRRRLIHCYSICWSRI